jgi:hypothetical protein
MYRKEGGDTLACYHCVFASRAGMEGGMYIPLLLRGVSFSGDWSLHVVAWECKEPYCSMCIEQQQ